MGGALLDHRYLVSSLVCATEHSRRFAGCHVGLDAPVRIVELRPPDQPHTALAWDGSRCASLAVGAATLRHSALPRVRDCFCAGGMCYVVEDVPDGERLASRLARTATFDLRTALRDGLLLCDAVALLAADAPKMLACLLIASTTLRYDADAKPRLITWDYARWWGGRGALDPGTPDLRAPELRAGARLVPDERAHVYSIAALVSLLSVGSTNLLAGPEECDLPAAVRAALEHALRGDPAERTPNAESFGRELADAARAVLPALAGTGAAEGMCRSQARVERERRGARARTHHEAPRASRPAGARSRSAVKAAMRSAGRAFKGSSCA